MKKKQIPYSAFQHLHHLYIKDKKLSTLILYKKGLVVDALPRRMHRVHVVVETPVGIHLSTRRATKLPRRHVLLGNVNFHVAFPLHRLPTQETDIAGLTFLHLCAHERLQGLLVGVYI